MSAPKIDVWYGPNQEFGQIGKPQTWVNILGNVSDPDGVSSLTYSLNGGVEIPLTIGRDKNRLDKPGDFNIDIAYADLDGSPNDDLVSITATDELGNISTKTVTIAYESGSIWPDQYSVDWSSVTDIQNVSQIVDGLWSLEGDSVRTARPGYDRIIALGDVSWDDYEVTVPITIHEIGNGIGIIFRWTGHTDNPIADRQPKTGWLPLGAIGWYKARDETLRIEGSDVTRNKSPFNMEVNTTYNFKMRVENSLYSLKVWENSQTEPSEWNLQEIEAGSENPQNGSIAFLSHYFDASFGDVIVNPIGSDEVIL